MTNLPPAHMGLLTNRMPLTPSLPTIASFLFQQQLYQYLRTPMHTAFGMALPPINPFSLWYYPFAVPPVAPPPAAVPEAAKGLDLSVKTPKSS
jgi:hypothetical protein